MFEFITKLFKSPVPSDEKEDTSPLLITNRQMLEYMKERWHLKIKTKKSKEDSLYQESIETLSRKVLPIDLKSENIIGYNRYKGNVWGMYQIKGFTGFYFLIDSPIQVHLLLEKKQSDNKENFLLPELLQPYFSLSIPSTKDVPLEQKIFGSFVQKTLHHLKDDFQNGDFLILNRAGIFIGFQTEQSEEALSKLVSLLFDLSDTIKFLKKEV